MALHSDYYQIAIFIVFPETTYLKSYSLLRLIYWQLLLIHLPIYPSVSCIPCGFWVLHMALCMPLCGQNHRWLSLSSVSEIAVTHLPSYLSGASHTTTLCALGTQYSQHLECQPSSLLLTWISFFPEFIRYLAFSLKLLWQKVFFLNTQKILFIPLLTLSM